MWVVELIQESSAAQSSRGVHATEEQIVVTTLKGEIGTAAHEQILSTGVFQISVIEKNVVPVLAAALLSL